MDARNLLDQAKHLSQKRQTGSSNFFLHLFYILLNLIRPNILVEFCPVVTRSKIGFRLNLQNKKEYGILDILGPFCRASFVKDLY